MRELMFNPYFEICALLLLTVISFFFFKKEKFYDISSVIFGVFLGLCFWDIVFDIASVYTITYSDTLPVWFNYTVNICLFIGRSLLVSAFWAYTMAITGKLNKQSRNIIIIFQAPGAIFNLLVLATPVTHWFFYFDEAKHYLHGPYSLSLYFIVMFYILVASYYVVRYRQELNNTQLYTIYFYIILLFAAIFIQFFFRKLLISGFAVTISVLMMYLTLQNPDYYVDKMTSLHDRQAFLLVIKQIFQRNKNNQCVVVLDINDFKTINNLLGLHGGDIILIKISEFLGEITHAKKQVFRIGGDRFAIICDCRTADSYISVIQRRFRRSWDILGSKMRISKNICKFPLLKEYISNSDDVMYLIENILAYSKSLNKDEVLLVDGEVVQMINRRLTIEGTLRSENITQYLELYFQPIFSQNKQRIVSAEVLIRVNDPKLGLIYPDEFIPIAEQSGAINKIGEITIERACKFTDENKLWEKGIGMVGINLSTVQCMNENIADYIYSIIIKYPRVFHMLNFEVTETTAAASFDNLRELMNTLSKKGITFSMDDYGQGFSNCESIINLPFNIIKLDKCLLWNSVVDEKARIVYQSTVEMLKNMNLKIVAEGAETTEQISLLKEYGVDYIQGYYYSKPLPEKDFIRYITDKNYETTGSML